MKGNVFPVVSVSNTATWDINIQVGGAVILLSYWQARDFDIETSADEKVLSFSLKYLFFNLLGVQQSGCSFIKVYLLLYLPGDSRSWKSPEKALFNQILLRSIPNFSSGMWEGTPVKRLTPKSYRKSFSDASENHKTSADLSVRAYFRQFSDWYDTYFDHSQEPPGWNSSSFYDVILQTFKVLTIDI